VVNQLIARMGHKYTATLDVLKQILVKVDTYIRIPSSRARVCVCVWIP